MPTPPNPSSSSNPGDDRNLVTIDDSYLAPTFEDQLRLFWSKNSRTVMAGCAVVLLAILAKGGYEIVSAQQEKGIAADYAAATSDTQLKSFIAGHTNHALGGLAALRLADQAYAAGQYAEARTLYTQAASILKNDTFGQRARLGDAICAVQSGAATTGEGALKQIVADLTASKMIRSEAAYTLARLAADAGNSTEALRFIEQVITIDIEGQWADRANLLRTTLPVGAAVSAPATSATEVPSISFK